MSIVKYPPSKLVQHGYDNGMLNEAVRKLVVEIKASPFLKHNLVFFGGSLVVAVLNYLFYPVLSRMLAPADFGEVQTLISLFAQVAIFLNVLSYLTIYITVNAKSDAERNQALLSIEYVVLLGGGFFIVLAVLLSPILKTFLKFSSIWPFWVLLLALGLSLPLALRMAYLRGSKRFAKSSLTDGIGSLAKLLLAPVLVIIGWKSFGAIMALALSQIISLYFGWRWAAKAGLRGFGIHPGHVNLKMLRPLFRYSIAVLCVSFGVTLLMGLDMLAVKHYFSPELAGLYAGVTTTARIVYFVTAPFTGVLLASISLNQPISKNRLQLRGTLALVLSLGGLALLFMTLFHDFAIKLFVGSKYLEFAAYLPKVSLIMLLLAIANTVLFYQIALKNYHALFGPLAATFLTLILLIIRHNSVGSVVGDVLIGSTTLVIITLGQYLQDKLNNREVISTQAS